MDETLIPDSVMDRRVQSGVLIESIEGGNASLLPKGNSRVSAGMESPASPKEDPDVKKEARSVSYESMKAIHEEDDELNEDDSYSGPSIDLTKKLPSLLFAKPPMRLPILKVINYHIWAQAYERLFKSREMID